VQARTSLTVPVVAEALLVEQPVELLVVGAVGTLDLAVEARRARPDVHVADAELAQVPVELGLELGPVASSPTASAVPLSCRLLL
jgi:hypothetical protein